MKLTRPVDPALAVIGQIGKSVGLFMITSQYNQAEVEDVIHRIMLGEKILVRVAGVKVFLVRDPEFDTWYLTRV